MNTNNSILGFMRTVIKQGNVDQLKQFITITANRVLSIELLQYAVYIGHCEMLDEILKLKQFTIDNIPQSITSSSSDDAELKEFIDNYRESPYIVQASMRGNISMVKKLISFGKKITELGHIGFSSKKHNSIISNCLGAAAYYGRYNFIQMIAKDYNSQLTELISYKAIEKPSSTKLNKIIPECNGYSPLQLCVAGKFNMQTFEYLLSLLPNIKVKDNKDNNLLHLSVIYNHIQLVKYLITNYGDSKKLDVNERNSDVNILYRATLQ